MYLIIHSKGEEKEHVLLKTDYPYVAKYKAFYWASEETGQKYSAGNFLKDGQCGCFIVYCHGF
jgi:hypothetical protein